MQALFLHVVAPDPALVPAPLPRDKLINGAPVVFFRTYVGAARKAVKYGLLGVDGLAAVVEAARADLERIEPESAGGSSRWADLNRDIALCQPLLAEGEAEDEAKTVVTV